MVGRSGSRVNSVPKAARVFLADAKSPLQHTFTSNLLTLLGHAEGSTIANVPGFQGSLTCRTQENTRNRIPRHLCGFRFGHRWIVPHGCPHDVFISLSTSNGSLNTSRKVSGRQVFATVRSQSTSHAIFHNLRCSWPHSWHQHQITHSPPNSTVPAKPQHRAHHNGKRWWNIEPRTFRICDCSNYYPPGLQCQALSASILRG